MEHSDKHDKIEFVSYDGEYPCLCMGTLTLRINGENKTFGNHTGCDYPSFWSSGGNVSFSADWQEDVSSGPWTFYGIAEERLPTYIKDRKDDVMDLFNSHVRQGCCGGCV